MAVRAARVSNGDGRHAATGVAAYSQMLQLMRGATMVTAFVTATLFVTQILPQCPKVVWGWFLELLFGHVG